MPRWKPILMLGREDGQFAISVRLRSCLSISILYNLQICCSCVIDVGAFEERTQGRDTDRAEESSQGGRGAASKYVPKERGGRTISSSKPGRRSNSTLTGASTRRIAMRQVWLDHDEHEADASPLPENASRQRPFGMEDQCTMPATICKGAA